MITPEAVDKALVASGFEMVETRDAALDPNPGGIPWFQPLTPSWNVFTQRFQFNWLGLRLTKAALYVMEMVRGVFRLNLGLFRSRPKSQACIVVDDWYV